MPRTVDTSSTLENFRVEHNNLATDIGAIGNLTTGDTSSVVNAINYIMDQYFFFQDFDFDGSDGATSNTVFSGVDNTGNTLQYSAGKVLVYKNGLLLRNGTDYTASNGTSITLGSSANNGDVVRVSSYTGSYQNVNSESSAAFDAWQSAGGVIYNKNTGGIVFNADASITTTPTVDSSFQFDGPSYHNDHVHVNSVSSSPKELRFRDADNSNYAGIKAPATISANYILTLPTDDGTSGQLLSTNGSGVLSWAAAGTAPDITITANNSANETVYPVFVDGATGTQGLESDTGLSYNPSSGMLTSTGFTGALTGNVTGNTSGTAATVTGGTQASITSAANLVTVGTITTGTWQGTAIASNHIGADAITGAKIADNAINSEHYTNASIDTAHIADSQITQALMASNAVNAAIIVDNSVGAAELNVSGNGSSSQALLSDGDGTFSWGSSGHSTAELQAIIGAMFSSNTETRIAATYQSGDGTIDLVVDDMTANTTYSVGDGGLTQNNFTNADHSKLDGIAASATANVGDITGVTAGTGMSGGGTSGTVTLNCSITNNNQLSNGAGYTTNTGTTTASNSQTFTNKTWNGASIAQGYLTGQSGTNTGDQSSVSGSSGSCSGNAASATILATTRAIGGVNFNGSSAINLPGVNTAGNQDTSGTAAVATAVGLTQADNNAETRLLFTVATANGSGPIYHSAGVTCNSGTNTITATTFNGALNGSATGLSGSPTVDLNNLTCDQIGVNVAVNGTDGRIDAGNDIVAFSSSDMTLKENIIAIPNALDKVLSLGGYTFDWKKEREEEHGYTGSDIGVLAQEVEQVLPSAVRDNCYGNKSVRYEKLIPLLVQSIKELKSELDDLKSSNS